jgi:hypothetical protein
MGKQKVKKASSGGDLELMAGSVKPLTARCDEIRIACLVEITTRSSPPETSSFYDAVDYIEFPVITTCMSGNRKRKAAKRSIRDEIIHNLSYVLRNILTLYVGSNANDKPINSLS